MIGDDSDFNVTPAPEAPAGGGETIERSSSWPAFWGD